MRRAAKLITLLRAEWRRAERPERLAIMHTSNCVDFLFVFFFPRSFFPYYLLFFCCALSWAPDAPCGQHRRCAPAGRKKGRQSSPGRIQDGFEVGPVFVFSSHLPTSSEEKKESKKYCLFKTEFCNFASWLHRPEAGQRSNKQGEIC